MGTLLVRPDRAKQPEYLAEIDWNNPITRGLQLAFDGRSKCDALTRRKFTGSGLVKPTIRGHGYEIVGDSTVATLAKPCPVGTGASAFILMRCDSIPTARSIFGRGNWPSGNVCSISRDGLDLAVYDQTYGQTSSTLGTFQDSGLHSYGVSGNSSAVTGYIDGKYGNTDSSFSFAFQPASLNWVIGTSSDDATGEYAAGVYLLCLAWNRVLSATEHLSLHVNPWQIFRQSPRFISVLATGSVQLLSPISDVSAGDWLPSTGTDLYATVDESSYGDTDYIYATSATTCTLALASGGDPGVSTGHKLSYRLLAGSGAVTVTLKQSTTTVVSWGPHTLTGAAQSFTQTLTGGQADSITDYSALRVEFEAQ